MRTLSPCRSSFQIVLLLLLMGLICPPRALTQEAAGPPQAGKAPPDVLVFTNGDQLTGKLERVTAGNAFFKSDMAGELTIPLAKVKELHSGSEFVALRKELNRQLTPLAAGTVTFSKDEVEIQPTAGAVQTLPAADLGYLVDVSTYARAVDHHGPRSRAGPARRPPASRWSVPPRKARP